MQFSEKVTQHWQENGFNTWWLFICMETQLNELISFSTETFFQVWVFQREIIEWQFNDPLLLGKILGYMWVTWTWSWEPEAAKTSLKSEYSGILEICAEDTEKDFWGWWFAIWNLGRWNNIFCIIALGLDSNCMGACILLLSNFSLYHFFASLREF